MSGSVTAWETAAAVGRNRVRTVVEPTRVARVFDSGWERADLGRGWSPSPPIQAAHGRLTLNTAPPDPGRATARPTEGAGGWPGWRRPRNARGKSRALTMFEIGSTEEHQWSAGRSGRHPARGGRIARPIFAPHSGDHTCYLGLASRGVPPRTARRRRSWPHVTDARTGGARRGHAGLATVSVLIRRVDREFGCPAWPRSVMFRRSWSALRRKWWGVRGATVMIADKVGMAAPSESAGRLELGLAVRRSSSDDGWTDRRLSPRREPQTDRAAWEQTEILR